MLLKARLQSRPDGNKRSSGPNPSFWGAIRINAHQWAITIAQAPQAICTVLQRVRNLPNSGKFELMMNAAPMIASEPPKTTPTHRGIRKSELDDLRVAERCCEVDGTLWRFSSSDRQ
jgi:hypothetical protein